MQRDGQGRLYSATDLVNFTECEHLTALDLIHLDTPLDRTAPDESAELIQGKGDEHERAYLELLRAHGRQVVDIASAGGSNEDKAARTLRAMRDGVEVIYQATFLDGMLLGHADFLQRVERPAPALGPWSYEAADTKLARTPKAKFLVQLAFYSHLLGRAQGAAPLHMHLALGDGSERSYRCADYMDYFRALLGRFMARVEPGAGNDAAPATYPLPCAHCDLCHWRERCEAQREADDHLCRVAGISRVQAVKLQAAGITTMERLGALAAGAAVPKMQPETLAKLRSQAALQSRARRSGERHHELLPLDTDGRRGFHRLPQPHAGDMFFDMEGDPYEAGGLEYLFGVGFHDASGAWRFSAFWAHTRAEERGAFEAFIDFVAARRAAHPGAHIYHYAHYEPTALKRLASMHATREVEVDNLLRDGALVDLYKVVREGVRISEPSYSIKSVEHFYRPAREGKVQTAGASTVWYERWRETGAPGLLGDIEAYNHDDVVSTRQLRDWLLALRPAGLRWGGDAPLPDRAGEEPPAASKAQRAERRLLPYREGLVDALPADRSAWTADHHLRELSWQLLDFHRRADKPFWWSHYERMAMDEDELREDIECLAGLQADGDHPPQRDRQSLRYAFIVPEQESKLADGDDCTRTDTGERLGKLSFDEAAQRASLKVGPTRQPLPERLSLGPGPPPPTGALVDALYRFADSVLAGDGRYAAVESLLRRDPPRLAGRAPGEPVVAPGADLLQGSIAAARAMDRTALYLQGPPGAGKTYTGARVIVDLLARGKRIGVMSNSHKAINHLLAGVLKAARERGVSFTGCKKSGSRDSSRFDGAGIVDMDSNDEVWGSTHALVAGTAWLFADAAADRQLDTLFVDEAGQVALANLVAAGTSARNIVLLGDQMQLAQPVQGVHPGRSGDSTLDYLLDGAATIAPDRGVFLATSWRMHPDVCRFISDAVYEGRLEPEPGNARRTLVLDPRAHGLLRPSGVVHAPLKHTGCSQRSDEEAALVREVFASALAQRYTDRDGAEHPMTMGNVLVVAPYNMQVNLLGRVLPDGARVGTVDKFQGQEAELVIVSMTTSSEAELPRHIEFLYSRNRLNVAISRAKCLAIVIASPALMAIRCATPQQMALANMLCGLAAHADTSRP